MQSNSSVFLIGIGIGMSIAVLGAIVDYWLSNRNNTAQQARQLPGCMLYIAGALGLAGGLALVISFIMSGSLAPALVLGAGILSGFYAGFAALILLYLLFNRFWTH